MEKENTKYNLLILDRIFREGKFSVDNLTKERNLK